jgi:uncharacterized protein YggE
MRIKTILILALISLSLQSFAQSRELSTNAANARAVASGTLIVQGTGDVQTAPDKATVHAGITTEAPTAAEAVNINNVAMANLIAAIENAGIPSEDIQTSNFNVYPRYSYSNGTSRLIGYHASNNVRVISRDIASVGALLDVMSEAGATNINGVYFEVENNAQAKEQALTAAVADAFNKASILAAAAGVTLGSPIAIDSTNGAAQVYVPYNRGGAELASDNSVPINPGQNTVGTTVTIVYEIQ